MRRGENLYSIDDKVVQRTLDNLTKYFSENNISYILIGGMAVQAYLYSYGLNPNRKTHDLDLILDEGSKIRFEETFLRELSPSKFKRDTIFGKQGYELYFNEGPSIGILFYENLPEHEALELKFGKKKISVNVLKYEYLLASKIKTYLQRREEKDLIDIMDLLKLRLKGRKINTEVFGRAKEYYGLSDEDLKSISEKLKEYVDLANLLVSL